MANPFCDPFEQCDALDGRLLIATAIQGPPLAWDPGEISLGGLVARGAVARPFVDIHLEQRWTAKEACYGPVRSVFSLAPGETIELFTSFRTEVNVSTLVEQASGASRQFGQPDGLGGGFASVLTMPTRQVGAYGSLLDAIGDVLDVVEGAASGLVDGVVDLVSHAVGGGGPGVAAAVGTARRAVEAITRTESRQEYRQHAKEEERETIQTVRRTFSNPYRDRTMQLRFIPVFRRFEVRTTVTHIQPGVAAQYGSISDARETRPSSKLAARPMNAAFGGSSQLNHAQAAVTTRANVASLQKPLGAMLRRAPGKTPAGANASGALLWSESYVREDSLHVPLAEAKVVAGTMKLSGGAKSSFEKAIALTGPAAIAKLAKTPAQTVHLFMGTHIEAVAGECVLQDLPPLPLVP